MKKWSEESHQRNNDRFNQRGDSTTNSSAAGSGWMVKRLDGEYLTFFGNFEILTSKVLS